MQAFACQTKISIEVDTDERAVVIGDPALLEQAVLALLDNAIKYNLTLRSSRKTPSVNHFCIFNQTTSSPISLRQEDRKHKEATVPCEWPLQGHQGLQTARLTRPRK